MMAALVLAASSLVVPPASADIPIDITTGLRIEQPTASPASLGGTAILSFRIVNESQVGLHLIGVSTPIAKKVTLLASTGGGEKTKLGSIAIPATETLDLTTTHLRYELSLLTRKLVIGDDFPVRFEFSNGSLTVRVHVHDVQK